MIGRDAMVCVILAVGCGPTLPDEPPPSDLVACIDMDPQDVFVAYYDGLGDEDEAEVAGLNNPVRCRFLESITAAVVDPTTGALIYGTSDAGVYRYTRDDWDRDPPHVDLPDTASLNDYNERLSGTECSVSRVLVSPVDGSVFYQCRDGKTYDQWDQIVLEETAMALAVRADRRFLVARSRVAGSLAEFSSDTGFTPLDVPPEFRAMYLVAARSIESGFRIAVHDDGGQAWLLRFDELGAVEVEAPLAPRDDFSWLSEYVSVLDPSGALYYVDENVLVRRGPGNASADIVLGECDADEAGCFSPFLDFPLSGP